MIKKIPKNGTVKSQSDHIIETAAWKSVSLSTYKKNKIEPKQKCSSILMHVLKQERKRCSAVRN